MTLRSFAFVLIAALLLALASFAAACGSDDEALSIEEYFGRLDALNARFEADLQEVDTENAEEEDLKLIQANFANTVAVLATFAGGVSDLEPPDEIKSQHEEVAEALRAYADALGGDYFDQVSNLDSIEELQALAVDEELVAAGARVGEACLVLEQLAADNGIQIDFNCGSGGR